jgi:CheY-like chemotaxis protein
MGGAIWVKSQPGQGSRFFIELPFQSRAIAASPFRLIPFPSKDISKSCPPKPPPLHVLVAEDNVINQKVVCGILRRRGWTFQVAATGQEAYECFLNERFDVILMDVQMPDVDGLQATAMIRREELQRPLLPTPIIALTAHASKSQHDQCIAEGMDAVVTKPVDVATLMDLIARVLGRNALAPV